MHVHVKNKIYDFLYNSLGVDKDILEDDTSLFGSELLNSLDVIQLITFLENEFKIKIQVFAVSLETFDNINCICQFVEMQLK